MNNVENKIKKEATGVLIRVILFLVYYFSLILLGIGLFVGAALVTVNFPYSIIEHASVRLWIFLMVSFVAMWFFCIQMGLYLIRPIFGIDRDSADIIRPEITKEECPELFSIIGDIALATGNKMPKHVYLSPEVNAFVSYDSTSIWSIFIPTRKNLTIGIGLLKGLNKSELKAIIGHEFGHFSQKTMRIGTITYHLLLVIQDIIAFTEENQKEDAIARASGDYKWYFHLASYPIRFITGRTIAFYRYIEKKNRSLSRYMEYEADNVACQIVGTNAHISALCKLEILSMRYNVYEHTLQALLSEKHYLENFMEGYRYCYQVLSEDESLPIEYTNILRSRVGDDAVFDSRVSIIDGWNTHPTLRERIENARMHDSNQIKINNEDASLLLSDDILNTVGLSRQKEIVCDLNLPHGWGSVESISFNDFKQWLLNYMKMTRLPHYLFPFLNNSIVRFDIPTNKELENEEISSPFTDKNRNMLLEFTQADRDLDTLRNIQQEKDEIHFVYDGKKDIDISKALELHTSYISQFNHLIGELDINIYKFLWKNTKDKQHLQITYWLLFYSNDCLYALQNFRREVENITSTLQFYQDNGAQISLNQDYMFHLSQEFRKVFSHFDFDNISAFCGHWTGTNDVSVDVKLKEWQAYLQSDCSSFDNSYVVIREVWTLMMRIFEVTNNERKMRALYAYKGELYEEEESCQETES